MSLIRILNDVGRLALDSAANEANHMRVLAQPTVSCNLKQICSPSWIGDEDSPQKIASMWCYIFGEGQRCADNVLVEEIDVIAFWIGRIVVKGKVASKHSIL